MAHYVFRMRVYPDQMARYRQEHRKVWPQVLNACRTAGLRNYSIFMAGPELIAYFEADEPKKALARLDRDPVMHEWWAYMAPVMEEPPSDAYQY